MDKALELVAQLAEKLGQTVEALWPEAVRYVVVDGLVGAIGWAIVFGLPLYTLRKLVPFLREEGAKSPLNQNDMFVGAVVAAILCVAVLPFALAGVFLNLPQVFAPEGYLVTKVLTAAVK